ncbi:MAG: hypothetical protein JNL60_15330, partial [Bacteroidia bacterium]|nr:hypothetical protein [Bacteroidia bacterium]
MKKLIFWGLVLGVTIPYTGKAQWYGQISYQHDSVIHSSANVAANVASGANSFVMGSYRPTRQFISTNLDFAIDAVHHTNGTSTSFEYQISGSCVKPSGLHSCVGVCIVENSNPQNAPSEYAMVGETEDGIFFATIDAATGTRLITCSWQKMNPSVNEFKPVIKESNKAPGFFYILANDGNVFHVMMINGATGNQLWGTTYKPTVGTIEARDLAESKYNTSAVPFQVVVVGSYDDPNSTTGVDGFWAGINPNSGIGNMYFPTTYDYNSLENSFTSVEGLISLTSSGAQSYAIGGSVNDDVGGAYQMVTRLTPIGSQVWNSLILPNATATFRSICRINERKNPNFLPPSPFELYCVARADYNYDVTNNTPYLDDNLVVYKLDDNGDIASFPAGVPTEFHYSGLYALGLRDTYADVTVFETGGGMSDGIQVFGTNASTPNQNDIVKSYFNGVNGCNETQTNIISINQITLSQQTITVNYTPFNLCSLNNPALCDITYINGTSNSSCMQTPPVAGGSNARPGVTTGLGKI